jgi:mRNA-degrading endonuclease toxin of MazEF toxin-antitoxin module
MSSTAISSSSLFSAHYDECPPIHVYDTETSRPVAVVLRPRQDAPSRTCLFCAATLRRATRQSPGIANGAPFRIEVTMLGLDIRFVVTSLDVGSAEWIYDSLYCARGQAENLIKAA